LTGPKYRLLSLGAGVQSTTLLLLAISGEIPPFDAAIFADTQWEPAEVYRHLNRLEKVAAAANISVTRVSAGNIRQDALDPHHRYASMPLFVLGQNGERGMARRQCTSEYKIRPIKQEVRRRLGYPGRARIPGHLFVDMAIGISVDEIERARDADVAYMHNSYPLLDRGWRRDDCIAFLAENGWESTPRSACLGCPFHADAEWVRLRDHSPIDWADAVDFDRMIRGGSARATADGHPMRGRYYLHRQRVPLDQAVLRPRSQVIRDQPGCGPWTCPHHAESAVDEPAEG
jgi:hypothetical protein